jgi:hypothetical protein
MVYSPFTALSNLSRETPASCVDICRACTVQAPRVVVLLRAVGPPMVTPRKALPQAYTQLQSTAERGLRSLAVSTDSGIY